jgi:hypothetical protein
VDDLVEGAIEHVADAGITSGEIAEGLLRNGNEEEAPSYAENALDFIQELISSGV